MTPELRANLKRLLAPRRVAFIGGNSAVLAAEKCVAGGFEGEIWGVNPRRSEMAGNTCFARVEDLPEPPDAVFLAVPGSVAVETVAALRDHGCGGAVCYTAGFGELGNDGAAHERKLVEAAGDMALVGPNCSGMLNFVKSAALWPFDHGGGPVERGVAFITQSGMLGNTITLNQRSVPFTYVISSGNQAMLGVEEILDVLVDDPHVTAIALYIEGLRDVAQFADVAIRALKAEKPIIVQKAGSSEIGAQLTVTHTGSLSGTDELYGALFDRLGIIRVDSGVAMLEALKMVTIAGVPEGRRVAAFTCSGGDSTMLADGGEQLGLSFPEPTPEVAAELVELLPPIAAVGNPLDYTTPLWGHEDPLDKVFKATLRDSYDVALMVQDYPTAVSAEGCAPYHADARAFISATQAAGVPAAICSILPENLDSGTREMLSAGHVAPLQGINDALIAISGTAGLGELRARLRDSGDANALRLPQAAPPPEKGEVLNEWDGKRKLAAYDVPVPDGRLTDAAGAPAAAQEIGFPVVVKLVSAVLAHKTEAGAVHVGLKAATEVSDAVTAIINSAAKHAPDLAVDEFLVERMIERPVAELLVGIRSDPMFGLAMVVGSGGTLVELIGDAVTILLPTDSESISRAIERLSVSTLMDGYRGGAAADKIALIETIMSLARFAEDNRDTLVELDVNPLAATPDGACALDVLLRMGV